MVYIYVRVAVYILYKSLYLLIFGWLDCLILSVMKVIDLMLRPIIFVS